MTVVLKATKQIAFDDLVSGRSNRNSIRTSPAYTLAVINSLTRISRTTRP